MGNKNFFDDERREFFQRALAQQFAEKAAKDSTRVDDNVKIPGINVPDFKDGDDVIEAYCKKHGISREDFDNIPAYQRRKEEEEKKKIKK